MAIKSLPLECSFYTQNSLPEWKRLEYLFSYERHLRGKGYEIIAGIDEAGRGPLAGPVVAAAVILPDKIYIEGLNDSKKLSAKRREGLYEKIYNLALDIGVGMANSQEIDRINILQATYSAMRRAYKNLSITPQYLLLDAVVIPDLKVQQEGVIHGDSLCGSIAAASIVAKVTRDRIMEELDESYPQYGFAQHKGYPTKRHIQAIEKYGPCAVHRRTFSRVKEWCFP